MGAYISQDPIGLAGGNPTLYGYVKDSNCWVDVFGLDCKVKTASEVEVIKTNTKKWKEALDTFDKGVGKSLNFRFESQKEALLFLKEAKRKLTKRRSYWHDEMKDKGIKPGKKSIVNEGFEYHLKDEFQGTNSMIIEQE